jgi:hypothetical protein
MVTISYDHWSQVPRIQSVWPWDRFQPKKMAFRGTRKPETEPRLRGYPDLLWGRFSSSLVVFSAFRSTCHSYFMGG